MDKWEIPTRTEDKGENILPDVAETILSKISEKAIDKKNCEQAWGSESPDRSTVMELYAAQ